MYQSPNFVKVDTKVKDVFANYGVAPQSCDTKSVEDMSYTEIATLASKCFVNNTSL